MALDERTAFKLAHRIDGHDVVTFAIEPSVDPGETLQETVAVLPIDPAISPSSAIQIDSCFAIRFLAVTRT